MVLCCICGVQLSAAVQTGARCVQCLRNEVDVGASVSRRGVVQHCGTCQRYLRRRAQGAPLVDGLVGNGWLVGIA
eukprot:Skav234882  [mRNA]  locus=scaffold840:384722:387074:- [translate_table: standard]